MRGFFITGTDTNVGKTQVAAALTCSLRTQGWRMGVMKPVASGCRNTRQGLISDDAELLALQASFTLPYELINPFRFLDPIAPHIAAAKINAPIELAVIHRDFCLIAEQTDLVIVEGVGGWKVPLNEEQTTADLAYMLNLPVIMVVGIRLGCINHALLTVESIARQPCLLAGWVANIIEPTTLAIDENIQFLRQAIKAPLLGIVPYKTAMSAEQIATYLDTKVLTEYLPGVSR